jgi:hypothetical protein
VADVANDRFSDVCPSSFLMVLGEPFNHLALPHRLESWKSMVGSVIVDKLLYDSVSYFLVVMVAVTWEMVGAGERRTEHPRRRTVTVEHKVWSRHRIVN